MLTVRGRHYLDGQVYDLCLADGVIQSIAQPTDAPPDLGRAEHWLAPGLIDIQVNGYQGYDFCTPALTPAAVVALVEHIGEAGVTALCPTITTNSRAATTAGLQAIAQACETSPLARQHILGVHLEGPYISPEDGPRGAHPREHARLPDWDELSALQEASGGRLAVLTLAPELPGALELIARATQAGIIVALGHHAADREQIDAAVLAGAQLSTHLGNGAHNMVHRHHNYIWEQLAHDDLWASIIPDGHHLPPPVVKSFFRTKTTARLILVSDAIAAAGLPPGPYKLGPMDIEKHADGSVRLTGTPYLAGSALKLCDGLGIMMRFAGATLGQAVEMASTNPARLLGLRDGRGALRMGGRADLVLLQQTGDNIELVATVAGGVVCYRR